MSKRYVFLGLAVMLAVIALDQGSKWALLELIPSPDQPPVTLAPFFDLVLVWNTGISFGLFSGHRRPTLLIAVSLAIIAILLVGLYKNSSPWMAAALGLVIGGAMGNVIDRLRFGAVADFFDAHIGPYHWPAFNIADSCIFIGVVVLCASSMFTTKD